MDFENLKTRTQDYTSTQCIKLKILLNRGSHRSPSQEK